MVKEGEGVVGATKFSQGIVGKINKTCRHIKRGLGGDRFKSVKHDPTMSRKRGDVQCNG